MTSESAWSKPRQLPHFNPGQETQIVTYRLGDALPVEVARRRLYETKAKADPDYRKRIEEQLDRGHGGCALQRPEHATLVIENWHRWDGERYALCAWVVMPNHVHVIIRLTGAMSLARIVQSWKSYTGRRLPFHWQRDYWDRCVRDHAHFAQAVAYVPDNPVKAGLCRVPAEWPWSSVRVKQVL